MRDLPLFLNAGEIGGSDPNSLDGVLNDFRATDGFDIDLEIEGNMFVV